MKTEELLIYEDNILYNLDAINKQDALKKIADFAYKKGIVSDADEYYKGLLTRENECSTGFGYGICIPHGRVDAVKQFALLAVTFKNELEWESIDKKKVDLAIVIACPNTDKENRHLKVLALLARRIMHEEYRTKLKEACQKHELATAINSVVK